jgi:hypothetical protein
MTETLTHIGAAYNINNNNNNNNNNNISSNIPLTTDSLRTEPLEKSNKDQDKQDHVNEKVEMINKMIEEWDDIPSIEIIIRRITERMEKMFLEIVSDAYISPSRPSSPANSTSSFFPSNDPRGNHDRGFPTKAKKSTDAFYCKKSFAPCVSGAWVAFDPESEMTAEENLILEKVRGSMKDQVSESMLSKSIVLSFADPAKHHLLFGNGMNYGLNIDSVRGMYRKEMLHPIDGIVAELITIIKNSSELKNDISVMKKDSGIDLPAEIQIISCDLNLNILRFNGNVLWSGTRFYYGVIADFYYQPVVQFRVRL